MTLRWPRFRFRDVVRLAVLATVMAVAVAIVGFHSHTHSHGTLTVRDAGGGAVTVGEWKLGTKPQEVAGSLSAGELTFTLQNTDAVQHDFYVVRSDDDPASLPTADGRVDLTGVGEVVASTQAFEPGLSGTLAFDFEPGEYVLFCNQAGHYEHGMYYRFSVR